MTEPITLKDAELGIRTICGHLEGLSQLLDDATGPEALKEEIRISLVVAHSLISAAHPTYVSNLIEKATGFVEDTADPIVTIN